MKKQHYVASLAVILVLLVAGITAYREGYLWKKTAYLSTTDKDSSVCPLHQIPKMSEIIEVFPGRLTISWMTGYEDAQWRLFPHANATDYGGHPPHVARIERLYCSECRLVRASWIATNETEQASTGQPPTRHVGEPKRSDKSQSESKGR